MRRIFLAILCLALLTTAVSANGTVTGIQNNTTLRDDGTCQVSLTVQFTLSGTEPAEDFPLPSDARDISLNGSGARTYQEDGRRWVELDGFIYGPGVYTFTLNYALGDRISREKTGLLLTLPLLSGFGYPIDRMDFSITFPGNIEEKPAFFSTYYPEGAESQLKYSISGQVLTGYFLQGLRDHESLTMTMEVSEKMFPQPMVKRWSLSTADMAMYGLILLSAVYWLVFLRCKPPKRLRRTQAPNGLTAGEMGCGLIGQGVDLNTTVISWAYMGYLSIHIDRNRRVLLRKRMDMGNERSDFEVRCFKTLFGGRRTVDGSGEHYGRLGRKAAKTVPGAGNYYRKGWGNPMVFRILAAGIGVFSGVSLASAFFADTVWRVLFSLLLGALGGVVAWMIQLGVRGIHLRKKRDMLIALVLCFVWLIISNWAGEVIVSILLFVTQLLAGLAGAYGGRRTPEGMQTMGEILGLRQYLKTLPQAEARTILRNNPDYFFAMIPYALALGVDRAFARQFGDAKLPACPYISSGHSKEMTARQWNDLLRSVLEVLDERQKPVTLSKFLKR